MEIMELRMLIGLAVAIIMMILLVMKTKVHTFIALLGAALVAGLIGGMAPADVMTAIQDGFGSTLKSTGIIIGLGVMMGAILEKTGAAERLAYSFLKLIGSGKEEWALGATGWVVSIPVFADSAQVMFAPLCKALSRMSGKSIVGLSLAMSAGLQLTHCLVPPTPGPLTAAGMLGVDVGQMIITGSLVSVPMFIVAMLYCKWLGKKIYQIPNVDGTYDRKEFKPEYIKDISDIESLEQGKELPGFWVSIAPILIPLLMIFTKTFADLFGMEGGAYYIISLIGSPVFALGTGTLLAIYGLARHLPRKDVLGIMDESIESTGMIMLVTGAGGSLGSVIKVSGAGDVLGELIVGLAIPAILIPFIIAALMRISVGSATVSITTAASLTAPLMGSLAVNPVLLATSCCLGAISFSYFNDSGFWVYNGLFGLNELKDQVKGKTAISLIMAGVGLVTLLIINIFI